MEYSNAIGFLIIVFLVGRAIAISAACSFVVVVITMVVLHFKGRLTSKRDLKVLIIAACISFAVATIVQAGYSLVLYRLSFHQ